jgi:hypothetical protein
MQIVVVKSLPIIAHGLDRRAPEFGAFPATTENSIRLFSRARPLPAVCCSFGAAEHCARGIVRLRQADCNASNHASNHASNQS